MSNKVPQIRFNGYSDAWEERKLGDVVGEIQSGNRLPKDSLTSGNIPYVVAQTKNEGVFKTISKKTLDYNGNPMKLFPGNSISFSIDNPEAMFYRSTEFYTSNIMRVIHADYLSHQQYLFILENMKSFTRGYDWSRKFSGPVVSNLEYLQPNEQEQCKIGSFILAFDNIITLHQRKLDLLKEQKKGYLQKMFPKNGEKVPELRFAGFADDWEERKLGEFSDVRDGTHASPKYVSQGHPMVTSKNLTHSGLDMTDVSFLTDEDFNEINKRSKVSIGDILFGMIGTIGNPVIVDRDDFAIKNVALIKEKTSNPITNKWLLQYLKSPSFNRFIQKENAGGTQKFIALGLIRDMKLRVPEFDEQQKIGAFFKKIDETITLHQRKLDLLKEQKKGYLQKMFV